MVLRIGINGFGRIGRMVLKAGLADKTIEFVGVNDLTDTKTLAHLFKYDSVHGKFDGEITAGKDSLTINGHEVTVSAEKDPAQLPWKKLHVDVVLECTGFFRRKDQAQMHITAGAKKVLLSSPSQGPEVVKTIVCGVNEHDLTADDHIVSNASCTTNALAPMAKVLNDNYTILKGLMTTTHGYTADQRLVDAPHKDLRRARSAAVNLIPTSTGAAKAVGTVIPALAGKLDGFAIRAPIPDGSIVNLVASVAKDCSREELNLLYKNVSKHHLKGILEYTDEPIVSSDIINNPHSVIFDSGLTKVMDKNLVNVVGWYDNEWGFSNRMVTVIKLMGKFL